MHQSICIQCGQSIGTEELRTSESAACPNCGGKTFTMQFHSRVQLRSLGAMTIKQRDPNKTGDPMTGYGKPSFEHVIGPEFSASGKLVMKERIFDKQSDSYFERITDMETGEIIHECEEPFSLHRGHGDAKKIFPRNKND
jgi:DNA-directed RNA polymerase subunit RPC12/RpoP